MKKFAALAAAALMLLSASACAVEDPALSSQTSSSQEETSSAAPVDASKMEDSLKGLAEYMKAKGYMEGDALEMDASFIGAEKGQKYTGSYEGNKNIIIEIYEYDVGNLNETAEKIIDSVKKDGSFELMGMKADAVLSDSGKYLMVYKDSVSDETHNKRADEVKADFKAFKK